MLARSSASNVWTQFRRIRRGSLLAALMSMIELPHSERRCPRVTSTLRPNSNGDITAVRLGAGYDQACDCLAYRSGRWLFWPLTSLGHLNNGPVQEEARQYCHLRSASQPSWSHSLGYARTLSTLVHCRT